MVPSMTTQMLLVEKRITSEEVVNKSINIDDFIWPYGRRIIESVEKEDQRLLEQDALTDDVKYGKLSLIYLDLSQYTLHRGLGQHKADLSDSKFTELDDAAKPQMPGAHSEHGDAGTPGGGADGDEGSEDGEDSGADGDIDEGLAPELCRELEDDEDDEDESEDEDEEEEDDDDDET